MPNLPERKPTRLKNYDYSSAGAYFITICTAGRKKLLSEIEIVGEGLCALPQTKLTDIGQSVENNIRFINSKYPNIFTENYVIMPNHIHLLITIRENNDNFYVSTGGHGDPPLQKQEQLYNVIGRMKSYTDKIFGGNLWQRSFHDHIIRNEAEYEKIWNYIEYNAVKWEEDCFYC